MSIFPLYLLPVLLAAHVVAVHMTSHRAKAFASFPGSVSASKLTQQCAKKKRSGSYESYNVSYPTSVITSMTSLPGPA